MKTIKQLVESGADIREILEAGKGKKEIDSWIDHIADIKSIDKEAAKKFIRVHGQPKNRELLKQHYPLKEASIKNIKDAVKDAKRSGQARDLAAAYDFAEGIFGSLSSKQEDAVADAFNESSYDRNEMGYMDIGMYSMPYKKATKLSNQQLINAGKKVVMGKYKGNFDKAYKEVVTANESNKDGYDVTTGKYVNYLNSNGTGSTNKIAKAGGWTSKSAAQKKADSYGSGTVTPYKNNHWIVILKESMNEGVYELAKAVLAGDKSKERQERLALKRSSWNNNDIEKALAKEMKSRSIAQAKAKQEKAAKLASKWNKRKYQKWVKDLAYNNDGVDLGQDYGYEMAQNAKFEKGLEDYVTRLIRREGGDESALDRIQWDIEAAM